ncbi:hypothetical protein HWV62_22700 [Athelia sp. TMB]|nr:hypothetical protein HWV62_22700 [Athelia sp. TMB]
MRLPTPPVDSTKPKTPPPLKIPRFDLRVEDLAHPGAIRFLELVKPVEALTAAVHASYKWLYTPETAPTNVERITLVLRAMDGVAYTTGSHTHKEIHFSCDHIMNSAPREKDEIEGVLTHEVVHCYQHNAKGSAPGGLIEGVADYVRLHEKQGPPHWKARGGEKWDAGYDLTAYFLDWVETRYNGKGASVKKLNAKMKDVEWNEGVFWELTGSTLGQLWTDPTPLHLPSTLPFPIKVVSLDAPLRTPVTRGTRLLTYSFVYLPAAPNAEPETRFGTWDSSIEGALERWAVKAGDVVSARRARERCALEILEPCTHGVQIGGLCGLCGKDMTDDDYTGFSDASRATIQMTHSAFGPTVSKAEAERLERETAAHLLGARKLSLIVDLDQTIVHATVDPTVGEWIAEGEAWEARHARREARLAKAREKKDKKEEGSDEESSSGDDDDETESDDAVGGADECNPNWAALRDVKRFRLGPESFAGGGKQRVIESEGVMYYIKPRPGWQAFLADISTKYQMHVYTMGTRAYAEAVCRAIDPAGAIFGGRLLSRDESGSLTQKSLQRLFPCDTSMVVIIDDRADVWEWSPNLVKVVPYDFFVGIGDINSTFLPKVDPITAGAPAPSSRAPAATAPASATPTTATAREEERERGAAETKQMVVANSIVLEAQLEERPLAKKQEALLDDAEAPEPAITEDAVSKEDKGKEKEKASAMPATPEKHVRKALLKNDDVELQRVRKILEDVHAQFFEAYESRADEARKRKPGSALAKPRDKGKKPYDVTNIIPRMRTDVLSGVHILFSSVIPLDTAPEATEVWRVAHMFGARCYTDFCSAITHVVAAKSGTVKVDTARKRGGIKVVWLAWFTDSVALWTRQDEAPYLLDDPAPVAVSTSTSPVLDTHQISSDPEPDNDDWDEEPRPPATSEFDLGGVDWNDVNDEVDAAMNESDDEDEEDESRSERSVMRSVNGSDDDESGGSAPSSANPTPKKRKRLRSLTPSEINLNGRDTVGSPLAKRKKLAADRTGASRLKDSISAGDLVGSKVSTPEKVAEAEREDEENYPEQGEGQEDDDSITEGGDLDDDFLAGALEEDWG